MRQGVQQRRQRHCATTTSPGDDTTRNTDTQREEQFLSQKATTIRYDTIRRKEERNTYESTLGEHNEKEARKADEATTTVLKRSVHTDWVRAAAGEACQRYRDERGVPPERSVGHNYGWLTVCVNAEKNHCGVFTERGVWPHERVDTTHTQARTHKRTMHGSRVHSCHRKCAWVTT